MTPELRTVRITALFDYYDKRSGRAELLELTALPVDGGPRALGDVFGSTIDPFIQDGLRRAMECGTGLVTIELDEGYLGPRIISVEEVEVRL
jgi:hypothetical protein